MRAALWFLVLFAGAAALALFAGENQATITVFWPPWRVDLSLNLVLLVLAGLFLVLHLALRALGALLELPTQARRWRTQQRERAAHVALIEAFGHLFAGRFTRARKVADVALAREQATAVAGERLGHGAQLRAMAHLVAAESAQSLQDKTGRDEHLRQIFDGEAGRPAAATQELRDGARLRAARWALDERDVPAALEWLDALPQGAQRRTLALRLRLKAARLAHQAQAALETARLLAKHRAFSPEAAQSLIRSLIGEMVQGAHDSAQLQKVWDSLEAGEQAMPEVAIGAASRLLSLQGDVALARNWLQPLWEQWMAQPTAWSPLQRAKFTRVLEDCLVTGEAVADRDWLGRIELAQQGDPREPCLQYLAGMACMKRQLWGKAEQLLGQAVHGLSDEALARSAWRALATLAQQRGDDAAAMRAWKNAAGEQTPSGA